MAALETHDDVRLLGEPIDNLTLAFVPPLGADDHHIRHGAPLRQQPVAGMQPPRPTGACHRAGHRPDPVGRPDGKLTPDYAALHLGYGLGTAATFAPLTQSDTG